MSVKGWVSARFSWLFGSTAAGIQESRVAADDEAAKQRRVDHQLKELQWAVARAGARPDSVEAATARMPELWVKESLRTAVSIDTGAALAWLRYWDDALAEFAKAKRGTRTDIELATHNEKVVAAARRAEAGT